MGRAFEYADGVGGRRRAAVIRAATGDDVIIGEQELRHAMRHFTYRLFYRLEDGRYLLAVVKLTPAGAFLASMYPTGRSIRPSHRRFRKVLP